MITASIVTYHNDFEELKKAMRSFLDTELEVKLYISDNSSNKEIKKICLDSRIQYIYNNANLGFGSGHNIAIKKAIESESKYHLILNPDVYFDKGTLEKLQNYMDGKSNVGLVMPKVLYPNGEIQRLCKLLPTPMNLIGRKFLPFKSIINKMDYKYEMKFTDYNTEMEIPCLSGCFMFLNTVIFRDDIYFDENYFMYLEDYDFCRRVKEKYRTMYYPKISIYHKFEKGSSKNRKLFIYHIKSAIYYFNKWGWFFDKKRRNVNKEVLKKFGLK